MLGSKATVWGGVVRGEGGRGFRLNHLLLFCTCVCVASTHNIRLTDGERRLPASIADTHTHRHTCGNLIASRYARPPVSVREIVFVCMTGISSLTAAAAAATSFGEPCVDDESHTCACACSQTLVDSAKIYTRIFHLYTCADAKLCICSDMLAPT